MKKLEKIAAVLLIIVLTVLSAAALNFIIQYVFMVLGYILKYPFETLIICIIIGISWTCPPIGKERQ